MIAYSVDFIFLLFCLKHGTGHSWKSCNSKETPFCWCSKTCWGGNRRQSEHFLHSIFSFFSPRKYSLSLKPNKCKKTDEWHDIKYKHPVIFTQLNARAASISMISIGVSLPLDSVVNFNMCKFSDMMYENRIHDLDNVDKSQNSHAKRKKSCTLKHYSEQNSEPFSSNLSFKFPN